MALNDTDLRSSVDKAQTIKWLALVAGAPVVWGLLYSQLIPFSEWVVSLLPVERKSHLGEAIQFFVYDTPKVLLLLTLAHFGLGLILETDARRSATHAPGPHCDP